MLPGMDQQHYACAAYTLLGMDQQKCACAAYTLPGMDLAVYAGINAEGRH